ncbi:MAG: 50S ribosome-binding GTPase, partial [Acidobacteria bacterium]|nr:50S ribosome-binding GTPase [Acidobacteriota bacterium]
PLVGRFAPGLGPSPRPRELRRTILTRTSEGGEAFDDALAVFFEGPRSSTGEDVVEITCHGSPAVVALILAEARAAGARMAGSGEFTRRALLAGKVDLAQAEGIALLTAAETRSDARRALGLAKGELSGRVSAAREEILDALAELEAGLDFAEDAGAPNPISGSRLDALIAVLGPLASPGSRRVAGRDPVVVLAGAPNAGKSTLFNALLGEDRALVAELPGTTRDAVAETAEIGGVRVRLVDTAGLRETSDPVEGLGVALSRRTLAGADLVVHLVDAASGAVPGDEDLAEGGAVLAVTSRVDLAPAGLQPAPGRLAVSARTGAGLPELAAAIAVRLLDSEVEGELLVLERHRDLLGAAVEALREARGLEAPELQAAGLRRALVALAEVTGEGAPEELLDRVFSRFCIGK